MDINPDDIRNFYVLQIILICTYKYTREQTIDQIKRQEYSYYNGNSPLTR